MKLKKFLQKLNKNKEKDKKKNAVNYIIIHLNKEKNTINPEIAGHESLFRGYEVNPSKKNYRWRE